jgi:hypothetical protein
VTLVARTIPAPLHGVTAPANAAPTANAPYGQTWRKMKKRCFLSAWSTCQYAITWPPPAVPASVSPRGRAGLVLSTRPQYHPEVREMRRVRRLGQMSRAFKNQRAGWRRAVRAGEKCGILGRQESFSLFVRHAEGPSRQPPPAAQAALVDGTALLMSASGCVSTPCKAADSLGGKAAGHWSKAARRLR